MRKQARTRTPLQAAERPLAAPAKPITRGANTRTRRTSPDLTGLLRDARAFAESDLADRTREEYAKQWAAFEAWCVEKALEPLPAAPQTLCLYLAHRVRQRCKVATLAVGLAAIAHEHARHGYSDPLADPEFDRTWTGIRRKHGAPPEQKLPATTNVVRAMVEALPRGLLGVRDRALLTLGFAGGFRRSELVALNVADLRFVRNGGLEVKLRGSKTDQERKGHVKEIARGRRSSTCVTVWAPQTSPPAAARIPVPPWICTLFVVRRPDSFMTTSISSIASSDSRPCVFHQTWIEGHKPDRWDILGATISLAGMLIIAFGPRP